MTPAEFQHIAATIPLQPGIYKYFDTADELLYVGKAKHLRKRVSSYFTKTFTNYKTHELVLRIARIEFTIVNSEQDAFLLENSLIKKYQPRFNINLKDDKTYPYIVIKKEPFVLRKGSFELTLGSGNKLPATLTIATAIAATEVATRTVLFRTSLVNRN